MNCKTCERKTSMSMGGAYVCVHCVCALQDVQRALAEERERVAKAIEAERERVFAEGGPTLGELAMYDVCAAIVRTEVH